MRILHLAQKPQRRGAEIFAAQLGAWLSAASHQVRNVYLYAFPGERPLLLGEGDVCIGGDEANRLERLPCGHPVVFARLRRLVGEFRPDIVQANGGRSVKYASLLAMASPGRHWKLVYRNIDSPVFWVRGVARRTYFRHVIMPRVDGVVGVSRTTMQEVYGFYRISAPGEYIPNGVDLAPLARPRERKVIRERLRISQDDTVLLFVGAMAAQKRPDRYVRLIRAVRDLGEEVTGLIVGDGELRRATENLAGELDVSSSIRFLGSQEDVADYLASADLFVSTSDSEGIPAAVLEAGFLRLPVIGFAVGGMQECVLHGQTGYLARPGDEADLLRLVRRLLRDPEERRRLGTAARSFVESEFSMDSVGRRYERFYLWLLDRNCSTSQLGEGGPEAAWGRAKLH